MSHVSFPGSVLSRTRTNLEKIDAAETDRWGWLQPTRHALGALLLERGHVSRAASVYRADIGLDSTLPRAHRHPDNVSSLRGFHECLTRLGQD